MTVLGVDLRELEKLVASGESRTLELKASTAQLPRAGETLCGFLNGDGGLVVIGVAPDGRIVGQQVADGTQREIARVLNRFEPPAPVDVQILAIPESDRAVILLHAPRIADSRPFTYDGRAYQRVGTTTSRMPQERYESLLLERAHARRRWENQPAVRVALADLDHEEILRTREVAIRNRRISAGTGTDIGDILDRLGLRVDGAITQAAQILYGTRFLPEYPQGRLKLGRFRGTTITGEILDNRQEYLHAFAIVQEAMAFLDRTLPVAAHFVSGWIEREDRPPVPPDALREVLLNAVMHRDYSHPGSHVAVAVFDDRIEAWGRGTNRVIEECDRWGVDAPIFEERGGAVVVTFRAPIGPAPQVTPQVTPQATPQVLAILAAAEQPRSRGELQEAAGLKDREHFRRGYLEPLLTAGWLEMTIPDKPRSPNQRYRTTGLGRRVLDKAHQE